MKSRFLKYYTYLIMLFLYVPMIFLILLSFNTSKSATHIEGFTVKWYVELFKNDALLQLLLNSVILAVLASIISTVIGTLAALGITAMKKKSQKVIMTVTNIPLTNPDIVTGISLALLFSFFGAWLRIDNYLGFTTLLIAHVTFCLPYIILSVMPKIRQMDPNLVNAALDLGCTPVKAFLKVTLHEIMPGIVTGMMMAFTYSLDDFVISYFVAGSGFTTLPLEIYSYTKKQISPRIYALFTLMFATIFIILILVNVFQIKEENRVKQLKKEVSA